MKTVIHKPCNEVEFLYIVRTDFATYPDGSKPVNGDRFVSGCKEPIEASTDLMPREDK